MNKMIMITMLTIFLGSSCKTIKLYERVYVNDKDMQNGSDKLKDFENNFENYREGSSGANGGKSGGGCGCY
ncbi:MAG: hypothetical protein ACI93N_000750 [Flavobacteriaceae bacterium]|jgi:hypothetical protein